jgi:hypothetical protein
MKKATTLALLLLPLVLISQNWQPVNPAHTYFYFDDTTGLIKQTVKVDSVSVAAGHPVYYLNTGAKQCDTCWTLIPCYNFNGDYFLSGIQGIFSKQVHQIDENKYWFFDTVSFVILPKANLDQTWLFDTLNNINAEVSDLKYEAVFEGIFDSTKTISLSSGKEILLSKSYGILRFPSSDENTDNYQLAGLQTGTENIGNTPPGFQEIFDYEVGDVFQYHGSAWDGSFPPPNSDDYTLKVQITSKTQTDNSVTFGRYIIKKWITYGGLSVSNDEVTYTNTPEFMANQLPGTLYDICADDQMFYDMCEYEPNRVVCEMHQFHCPHLEIVKAVGNYIDPWEINMLVPCEDGINVMANVYWEYLYAEGKSYASGLGQVSDIHFFIEQANLYNIEGYVKDGDTIGTITPDEILLDVKETSGHQNIKIYPNPADDILFLETPVNSKVQIYDLIGQVVFDGTFTESKNQIKLGDFLPGIYLLKVFSGDRVYNQKVVVK